MTKEEKELLLKDLASRVPYGVMVECSIECGESSIDLILSTSHIDELVNNSLIVKPYLRPLSSMTDEEREEYENLCLFYGCKAYSSNTAIAYELIDWLNAHHFDYRGLIEKGLALEAPKDMYNF